MRGCDELRVQQLLNELGRRKQELEEKVPKLHEAYGYCVHGSGIDSPGSGKKRKEIDEVYAKINELAELAQTIEREAGALWDRNHSVSEAAR